MLTDTGPTPLQITNDERTFLSTWLKQGRDWLILQGRADSALQIFFPKFENNFEAAFSRVKFYFCLAIAAGKISNFSPRKVALKIIF
jgi:hypothetical protein